MLKKNTFKSEEFKKLVNKKSKYKNKKTLCDGIIFDSKKEAHRFKILSLMQSAGEITELKTQQPFEIIHNEIKVCKYLADFTYRDKNKKLIVEDVKSEATKKLPVYRLKKKLMLAFHKIEILEV